MLGKEASQAICLCHCSSHWACLEWCGKGKVPKQGKWKSNWRDGPNWKRTSYEVHWCKRSQLTGFTRLHVRWLPGSCLEWNLVGSFLLSQNETGMHASFQLTFRCKTFLCALWLIMSGMRLGESKINIPLERRCHGHWQWKTLWKKLVQRTEILSSTAFTFQGPTGSHKQGCAY